MVEKGLKMRVENIHYRFPSDLRERKWTKTASKWAFSWRNFKSERVWRGKTLTENFYLKLTQGSMGNQTARIRMGACRFKELRAWRSCAHFKEAWGRPEPDGSFDSKRRKQARHNESSMYAHDSGNWQASWLWIQADSWTTAASLLSVPGTTTARPTISLLWEIFKRAKNWHLTMTLQNLRYV